MNADKLRIARVLAECSTLLELTGANPFRCNAYRNAARAMEQLEEDLEELLDSGELGKVRGIGNTMVDKITTLARTGTLEFHENLREQVPAGLVEMLRIPGFGPKKIKLAHDELGICDITQLREACVNGSLAQLKGFGKKTSEKILSGLEYLSRAGQRHHLDKALAIAESIRDLVCDHPKVKRSEICGSLRRRRETIRDVDILVSTTDPELIMDRLVSAPGIREVIVQGPTKSSVEMETGIQVDIRAVSDAEFPFALHYFTGSKEHNIRMRSLAIEKGLRLNEYALAGEKESITCKDESDIFEALGLTYVPPELREDTGEIEAARKNDLPSLIEYEDLKGTFHCHTTWSDGTASLEEMAVAARKLGFRYLGIADHSRTAVYASGLSIEKIRQQHQEIDQLNQSLKGIRLLKGIESDILPDGQLDYPDAVLETFDYVVASVHSSLTMSRAEMTRRIVKAVSHPCCSMLGHPTGRILLKRDGYQVNLDAVIDACARHKTAIEINAHPKRLDLDWKYCKIARSKGVPLVINPDAHSTAGLEHTWYGVTVARRGWLEPNDVWNTRDLSELRRVL